MENKVDETTVEAHSGTYDSRFRGRVAIVTGAAHGFGRETARQLAQRGAQVVTVDVLETELQETLQVVTQHAQFEGTCRIETLDITDELAVDECVKRVIQEFGRVDILVNNAGGVVGQTHKPIEQVSKEDWHKVVDVNLTGAFLMIRAVAASMKEEQYGRIVNVSSGAGRSYSLTGIQAYASAKAGQIGLTRQMARELGPWNITVNNVAPGFVRSNPTSERQWQAMGPDGQQRLLDSLALRRLGTVEDIANAILFFASDEARYITGQIVSVDGGHHMF